MVVVCVSRLLLGFLLFIVKLSPASKIDVTGTLDGQEDTVVQNYQVLLLLGLVQPTGSVVHPHWMLPHGVFLFRKMIFARRLVRFSCLMLLLCGDILPNPGPPRYLCGVCRRAVRPSDNALLCDSCGKWFHIQCTRGI